MISERNMKKGQWWNLTIAEYEPDKFTEVTREESWPLAICFEEREGKDQQVKHEQCFPSCGNIYDKRPSTSVRRVSQLERTDSPRKQKVRNDQNHRMNINERWCRKGAVAPVADTDIAMSSSYWPLSLIISFARPQCWYLLRTQATIKRTPDTDRTRMRIRLSLPYSA